MRKNTKKLLVAFRKYKAEGLENIDVLKKMQGDGFTATGGKELNINAVNHLSKLSYRMKKRPYVKRSIGSKEAQPAGDIAELSTLILSSKLSDEAKVKALRAIYA